MRYYPAALALSLLAAITASVGHGKVVQPMDPRAAALLAEGRAALAVGKMDAAIDSFEAALTVQPGLVPAYLALGDAARGEKLQGKAIHYYRQALVREPDNYAALSGEGVAMAEKGAVEKAKDSLAALQKLCGSSCPETQALATAIERGPVVAIRSAEAVQTSVPPAPEASPSSDNN